MHFLIHLFSRFRLVPRTRYVFCLILLICLFLGAYCGAIADPSLFPLMHRAVFCRVSIVCLAASQLLPFLFVAFAAVISNPVLLMAVCAYKFFAFSYVGVLVSIAFGSAGWLIRFLFLFCDICLVPALCWFSLHILSEQRLISKTFLVCFMLVIVTVLFDHFFISDFLMKLI